MDGQIPLCIGREVVPKQETCPANYELVTASDTGLRRCRTYTKSEPIITCASGFVEDAQGCLQTITSSPRLLCPEDYILQYSRCIKQVEDMPNKMCPAGFELIDDDQCSQTVYSKPIPNCPDDYMFDNVVRRCYRVDVQYDFAAVDTNVYKQNYTSIVQTGDKIEKDKGGDSETIKEIFQTNGPPPIPPPFQGQAPNYPDGRYPPFQRMLPPQTQSQPIRPPPGQTMYPPQAYLQSGAYSNYGGVVPPVSQFNTGAAGYGYPFPGFQQYAPAPRLTNSPSYPVYMRSLSEEKAEL